MEQALVISSVALWVVVLLNLLLTLALVRRLNSGLPANISKADEIGLKVGTPAPDFIAETLDGKAVTLANYAGRSVAFIFIAPDCGPCREALPGYEATGVKAERAGVELVLVSTANKEETRALAEEFQLHLQVLVAPPDNTSFMDDYKLRGTPSYTLIDREGNIQSAGRPSPQKPGWKALVEAWESAAPDLAWAPAAPRR
jgi:peroxiredoxin